VKSHNENVAFYLPFCIEFPQIAADNGPFLSKSDIWDRFGNIISPEEILVMPFGVENLSTIIGGSDVGVDTGGETGLSRSSVASISCLGSAFIISVKLLMLAMLITFSIVA
jgi:hypothetical protein